MHNEKGCYRFEDNERDGQHIAEKTVVNSETITCMESSRKPTTIAEAKDHFNPESTYCKYCNQLCQI